MPIKTLPFYAIQSDKQLITNRHEMPIYLNHNFRPIRFAYSIQVSELCESEKRFYSEKCKHIFLVFKISTHVNCMM